MSIIKRLLKTLSKGKNDWENDPEKLCKNCSHKSFLQKERFYCDTCSCQICNKCKIEPYYLYEKYVCSKCNQQNRKDLKNVVVVKSNHIGGHNIIQEFDMIESDMIHDNYDVPADNLKYKAFMLGANGITSFSRLKETFSEQTENKEGVYYYSMFGCKGVPVLIEKYSKSKERLS